MFVLAMNEHLCQFVSKETHIYNCWREKNVQNKMINVFGKRCSGDILNQIKDAKHFSCYTTYTSCGTALSYNILLDLENIYIKELYVSYKPVIDILQAKYSKKECLIFREATH